MKKNIVMFSGGKDSTAMLLIMAKLGMRIDEIINLDSTWEFPAARSFVVKMRETGREKRPASFFRKEGIEKDERETLWKESI